jgi:hypothetical protein
MKLTTTKKALGLPTGASITRHALAICALSMACTPAFAQKGFDFGLKGNIQTTSLINSNDQQPDLSLIIRTIPQWLMVLAQVIHSIIIPVLRSTF